MVLQEISASPLSVSLLPSCDALGWFSAGGDFPGSVVPPATPAQHVLERMR